MMRAYDERYLDDAMRNLGEAADYAVNACNMTLQKFFDLFVTTGFATQFGNGVPKIISGLSGTAPIFRGTIIFCLYFWKVLFNTCFYNNFMNKLSS